MKVIYIKQTDLRDCGVSCLMSIVRYYGGYVRREYVREITNTSKDGVSAYNLIEAAPKLGLEGSAVKSNIKKLNESLPLIAHVLINNNLGHFVVVTKISSNYITVMDPNTGFQRYSYQEWQNISTNTYLLFKPQNNIIKQVKEDSFLKVLFSILKKYKKTFLLVIIFSLIYSVINVLMSYGIEIFLKVSKDNIMKLFIFFIMILLIKECSNLFRNYLVNYLNHSLDKTLIHDVYNHIIKLPYSYFKCRKKGDIITRIEDVSKIRDVISKCVATVIIDCLFVLITLFAMFHVHKKLTVLVLGITFIYIIIILLYSKKISKKMKKIKENEVCVNNHLIESLSSIDTIKGMQLESYLQNKLTIKHNDLLTNSFELNKTYFQENFLKDILYGFCTLVILLIGCLEINLNNLSVSTLMVYMMLLIYYFNPITNICNMELLVRDASLSFIRIKELLNVEEEKSSCNKCMKVSHLKGYIDINRLSFSYNGLDNNLECQKLNIKAGDKVLLYGESGGGKSTLMKLLVGYFKNYKGDIKLDNIDINDYDLSSLRKRITYVSQDEVLYTDTIYNNIVFDENIPYEEYKNVINLTGVDNIIKRSLLKDEMMLENNGSNISGGEKQRIIISRSLIKKSDIYIFDEAFSALDIESERKLLKKIFEFLKGKTIIVISHRFNNRDLYQKYVLFKKGRVYEY